MASGDCTILHRLVWFDDDEGLDAYLAEKNSSSHAEQPSSTHDTSFAAASNATVRIIDRKFRGMTPLHLAIQLGHMKSFEVLLKHGADTLIGTDLGFMPLQEATSIGDREMMRRLLIQQHEQIRGIVKQRQPKVYEIMHDTLQDYYLEMNWDFKSWVPFFSMLCPSDCYRIWKKGNRVRIDTSLLGFDKLHWLRGNVSFLFVLHPHDVDFYLLDHDRRLYQQVRKLRDFTETELEEDLNLRLNQEVVSGRVDTRQQPIRFSRSRSIMGLGDERLECIGTGEYESRVYSIENLEWVTRTRKEHLRDRPEGDLSEQTSSWFLGYGGRTAIEQIRKQAQGDAEGGDSGSERSSLQSSATFYSADSALSSRAEGAKTVYKDAIREIRDALSTAEEQVVQDDVVGIKEHLDDFDPNRIDSLLNDANQLAYIHTPSLARPHPNGPPVSFEAFFALDSEDLANLPYLHVGRRMAFKENRKHLAASLWMSDDFPLSLGQLLPLIEMMSPSNEHFDKLRQFISLRLPPGFPVQIEIPVLMFLSARITFKFCTPWTPATRIQIPMPGAADPAESSASWFQVPPHYEEGVVIKSLFKKYDS